MSSVFVAKEDKEGEDDHQTRQLREIFRQFDMDNDGSITLLELAALLRSLGIRNSGDQIHTLLSRVDANHNGAVEFEELATAILPSQGQGEVQLIEDHALLMEVFKRFDRDGNGVISPAELAKAMAKMGEPVSYKELAETIREADADGDGVINFTEFATIMARSAAAALRLPL